MSSPRPARSLVPRSSGARDLPRPCSRWPRPIRHWDAKSSSTPLYPSRTDRIPKTEGSMAAVQAAGAPGRGSHCVSPGQDAFRIGRCRVFMAPDRGPMSPRSDPCHEATMLSAAEVRASEDVAGSGAPIDEPGSAATTYASRAEGPPHARAGRATRRSRVGSRPPREARGRLSGRGVV